MLIAYVGIGIVKMNNNIIKLLGQLRQNLSDIQKMDYSELKEKIEVINDRYKDIEDNIKWV